MAVSYKEAFGGKIPNIESLFWILEDFVYLCACEYSPNSG